MTRAPGAAAYECSAAIGAVYRAVPRLPGALQRPAIEVSEAGRASAGLLSLDQAVLRIAPFVVSRFGQRYRSADEIRISVAELADTAYRIIAVHDFGTEDCNPDLDEGLAAIYLARRIAGRWQEAEDHPVECRALAVLGRLDVAGRCVTPT
jgi:hypothetical protein